MQFINDAKDPVYLAETYLNLAKYNSTNKVQDKLLLESVKTNESQIPLSTGDYIEIIVKTTLIEGETPRGDSESGHTTPGRKSISRQSTGSSRRNTAMASVPFIPESPSRRTSFKMGTGGDVVMEQEDLRSNKGQDEMSIDN